MARPRGTGSLIVKKGGWITIKYYQDGAPREERAHTKDPMEAQRLLNRRLGDLARGKLVVPRRERVRISELLQDQVNDAEINHQRSLRHTRIRSKKLKALIGFRRAESFGGADVRELVISLKGEGLQNGTINRYLALLRRAFNLGVEAEKISRSPKIKALRENPPRTGFFERAAFEAVRGELRKDVLKDMATLAYWTGWRSSEIKSIENRQVDAANRSIVIEPGITKGGEGRVVPLPDEAWAAVKRWYDRRATPAGISRLLFHRKNGAPIKDFYGAWRAACVRAGQPGRRFHDLRRTASRDLVRDGTPESVAMKITGHRTRSVFERYNIVTPEDVRNAALRANRRLGGHGDSTRDSAEASDAR